MNDMAVTLEMLHTYQKLSEVLQESARNSSAPRAERDQRSRYPTSQPTRAIIVNVAMIQENANQLALMLRLSCAMS